MRVVANIYQSPVRFAY